MNTTTNRLAWIVTAAIVVAGYTKDTFAQIPFPPIGDLGDYNPQPPECEDKRSRGSSCNLNNRSQRTLKYCRLFSDGRVIVHDGWHFVAPGQSVSFRSDTTWFGVHVADARTNQRVQLNAHETGKHFVSGQPFTVRDNRDGSFDLHLNNNHRGRFSGEALIGLGMQQVPFDIFQRRGNASVDVNVDR